MPTATRTGTYGVVDVTYIEDNPSSSNYEVVFPDGYVVHCEVEWIVSQIEDGAFLLVSLVDRDELQRRLG